VPGGTSKLGYCNGTRFVRILVLAVAAARPHQPPSILLEQPDQFADLHRCLVSTLTVRITPAVSGRGERTRASGPLDCDVQVSRFAAEFLRHQRSLAFTGVT